jgi:hypothetical protein
MRIINFIKVTIKSNFNKNRTWNNNDVRYLTNVWEHCNRHFLKNGKLDSDLSEWKAQIRKDVEVHEEADEDYPDLIPNSDSDSDSDNEKSFSISRLQGQMRKEPVWSGQSIVRIHALSSLHGKRVKSKGQSITNLNSTDLGGQIPMGSSMSININSSTIGGSLDGADASIDPTSHILAEHRGSGPHSDYGVTARYTPTSNEPFKNVSDRMSDLDASYNVFESGFNYEEWMDVTLSSQELATQAQFDIGSTPPPRLKIG